MTTVDNNYTNILISNNPKGSIPYPPNIQAVYNETLSQAILQDPSKYYCSINRFTIPMNLIPIFSFPVNRDQNNANLSQLIIGIETALGVGLDSELIYLPQNDIPPPVSGGANISYEDSLSPYYFVYSIQHMIDIINNSLDDAYIASGVGGGKPFYIYNPTTKLISLIVTAGFLATGAKIYMNSYLQDYLQGFSFRTKNYNTTGPYKFYHVLDSIPYGSPVGGPYEFKQERTSIPAWFDISRVIVTSSSLPIANESTPNYNPNTSEGTNGTVTYNPIVTDFAVSYTDIDEYASLLVLDPSPQYRLIDMNTQLPVNRLNFNFQWVSKTGAIRPIYCSPGNCITMKIAFLKRELYIHK